MIRLLEFNQLEAAQAEAQVLAWCSSTEWAKEMVAGRPYTSVDQLCRTAGRTWANADREDVLEAILAHPLIGDKKIIGKDQSSDQGNARAAKEQKLVALASEQTLEQLEAMNSAYYQKHGFIFLIFAKGKPANEMLAALMQRIENTTEVEIHNAAVQQGFITENRIRQSFSPAQESL